MKEMTRGRKRWVFGFHKADLLHVTNTLASNVSLNNTYIHIRIFHCNPHIVTCQNMMT